MSAVVWVGKVCVPGPERQYAALGRLAAAKRVAVGAVFAVGLVLLAYMSVRLSVGL